MLTDDNEGENDRLSRSEVRSEIYAIFHPEPIVGNEGPEWYETPPFKRLNKDFGLDTSYWRPFEYGSISPLVRIAVDDSVNELVRAQQVPFELFLSALQLLGESAVTYWNPKETWDTYQYYPAILFTAWAAFEAFVRIFSELLTKTVPGIPNAVRLALLEKEEHVDERGKVKQRKRPTGILDRYWLLIKYGFGHCR